MSKLRDRFRVRMGDWLFPGWREEMHVAWEKYVDAMGEAGRLREALGLARTLMEERADLDAYKAIVDALDKPMLTSTHFRLFNKLISKQSFEGEAARCQKEFQQEFSRRYG